MNSRWKIQVHNIRCWFKFPLFGNLDLKKTLTDVQSTCFSPLSFFFSFFGIHSAPAFGQDGRSVRAFHGDYRPRENSRTVRWTNGSRRSRRSSSPRSNGPFWTEPATRPDESHHIVQLYKDFTLTQERLRDLIRPCSGTYGTGYEALQPLLD